MISGSEIAEYAKREMLDIKDDEERILTGSFDISARFFDMLLNCTDTQTEDPAGGPDREMPVRLRNDTAKESFDRTELLSTAAETENGFYVMKNSLVEDIK